MRGVSGSLFLLSKNRLSDNKSKAVAITILRTNFISPRANETIEPISGKGENINATKPK